MKATKCRVSSFEFRERQPVTAAGSRHTSHVTCHFIRAFTLIELLTVIAIIGVLAALLAPVIKNFSKPEANVAATRQLLDDCARARALAMSERSTVYMVFIPTNFWLNWVGPALTPINNSVPWAQIPLAVRSSMITTQAYGAQMNGYMLLSLRDVGDQPGRSIPKDLTPIKTLPPGSFIAPYKFSTVTYASGTLPMYPTNRPDLPIYAFLTSTNIPFPTSTVLTNTTPSPGYFFTFQTRGGLTLPYIAFNYLGQLTPGDGSVLPYDENIPLDYGTFGAALNPATKLPIPATPSFNEEPPGNSTNISYNIIHIDRLTGRARLERQDQL
jgi:prepilin-type N-terminal cleavage/methylation domain-containing protein